MAKREFVIRGITPNKLDQIPAPRGTIENVDGYKEKKASDLSSALVEIFTDQTFRKMLPTPALLDKKDLKIHKLQDGRPQPVVVIKVKIGDKNAAGQFVNGAAHPNVKEDVWKALLTWSEKSRVKGVRGWRVSAVRQPRWENGVATTEVVIGGAIFYNNRQVTVGIDDNYLAETMDDLQAHLSNIGAPQPLTWKK